MQARKPRRTKVKKPESYTCAHCNEVKEGQPRAALINGYPFPEFCSMEHCDAYEQERRK